MLCISKAFESYMNLEDKHHMLLELLQTWLLLLDPCLYLDVIS